MIIRILLAGFSSCVGGVCYLSGLMRLMSGLLIGFGVLASLFFAIVFLMPGSEERLWFPIYGNGSSWPFFLLAFCLLSLIFWLFLARPEPAEKEQVSGLHLKYLAGGLFLYLCALFVPAFFWFPSEEKRMMTEAARLGVEVFSGVCAYLLGSSGALFLLYRASKGTTDSHPDMMRRFVPALFSFFHLDKMPALVAYLLIYSPETYVVFPKIAALALAGYIPVAIFLAKICFDFHNSESA